MEWWAGNSLLTKIIKQETHLPSKLTLPQCSILTCLLNPSLILSSPTMPIESLWQAPLKSRFFYKKPVIGSRISTLKGTSSCGLTISTSTAFLFADSFQKILHHHPVLQIIPLKGLPDLSQWSQGSTTAICCKILRSSIWMWTNSLNLKWVKIMEFCYATISTSLTLNSPPDIKATLF